MPDGEDRSKHGRIHPAKPAGDRTRVLGTLPTFEQAHLSVETFDQHLAFCIAKEQSTANAAASQCLGKLATAAAPTLAAANGFLVASVADPSRGRAEVIVINLGAEGFRAFTSVCTHQGCTVSDFTNGRIRCPCHGSEFDKSGSAVVGPASSPLKEYRTAVDTVRRIISVTVA